MKILERQFIAMSILILSFQNNGLNAQSLTKVWETSGFNIPESVLMSTDHSILYVANINGNPTEKDSNGFISILGLDGKMITHKWVEGLHAPKGMGIYKENLYVADIDRIVEINIKSGNIEKFIPVKGAQFLNDIAVTHEGTIFISDSKSSKYYKLKNGKVNEHIFDNSFKFPNGLCVENEKILAGTGDRIISFSERDIVWKDFMLETGSVDGLSIVDEGIYIFSHWEGKVFLAYKDQDKELILDTSADKINAADIYYNAESMLLYVPTFHHNTVSCYKLSLK